MPQPETDLQREQRLVAASQRELAEVRATTQALREQARQGKPLLYYLAVPGSLLVLTAAVLLNYNEPLSEICFWPGMLLVFFASIQSQAITKIGEELQRQLNVEQFLIAELERDTRAIGARGAAEPESPSDQKLSA